MCNRILILALCSLAVNGCQSTPPERSVAPGASATTPVSQPVPSQPTLDLAPLEIAKLPQETQRFGIGINQAIELVNEEQHQESLLLLQALGPLPANQALANALHRTLGEIMIRTDNPVAAIEVMEKITDPNLLERKRLAQLCVQHDQASCASQQLIAAQAMGTTLDQETQDLIWRALMQAVDPPAMEGSIAEGWLLLRQRLRQAGSVQMTRAALAQWRKAHPRHPANLILPSQLGLLAFYQPPKIGVMLPVSGSLQNIGLSVRGGFMSGYFADLARAEDQALTAADTQPNRLVTSRTPDRGGYEEPPSEPVDVVFFDTESSDLPQIMQVARSQSVDLLIGPLLKTRVVESARSAAEDPITQLMLNYIEGPANPADQTGQGLKRFQLGTAIEDETNTLVNLLNQAGHQRLLVVVGSASWARRALFGLRSQWQGEIVVAEFDATKNITESVGRAMDVEASKARHQDIIALIGESTEFLPRARRDFDAVVALTRPNETLGLVPALKFHFADQLPAYVGSQAIRGIDKTALAGFTALEMPILAAANGPSAVLNDTYALSDNPLAELYALGLDAYQLGTWLSWLEQNPTARPELGTIAIDGATGQLRLTPSGRVQRTPTRTRIDYRGNLRELSRSP